MFLNFISYIYAIIKWSTELLNASATQTELIENRNLALSDMSAFRQVCDANLWTEDNAFGGKCYELIY